MSLWLFLFFVPAVCAASVAFPAEHDHAIGGCHGTLVFTGEEIRYEGAPHAAAWPYAEIQELRLLDNGQVHILTYQDGSKWRLGADRAFNFKVDGDLQEVASLLSAKLDQRLVLGFAQVPQTILAQFRVKRLRSLRGDEGTLTFGERTVTYQSSEKGESRTWRYSDIDTLSLSDPFHITINTYEQQAFHYATRRAFNFQLKEPIREEVYDDLWRRINRSSGLEVLSRIRKDLEAQTDEALRGATVRERTPDPPEQTPQPPQLQQMRQILRQEGVPENLLAVAKVESGFNPLALSPKNARGMWQFIPETARRFGLRVDSQIDERTDPAKSTQAAARYLRELYAMFGDWKLALAGYNAGEKRVQSARARAGSNEFSRLAFLLPPETRSYVPAVLASSGGAWVSAAGRGYRVFAPFVLTQEDADEHGN